MDVVSLSRLQFAITSIFHFLFVPVTLGLSILIAFFEWRYVLTRKEIFKSSSKFWGRLFLINFAIGVLTGITLEFQFGMNFAQFSKYIGDVFGSLLAIEATMAFFLESVFIGLWAFGGDRISPKIKAISITIVAFASNISALWIILANGWMQNPVGFILNNNRAEMVDFLALISNPYGLTQFFHTLAAAYTLSAFFMIGISAYHLLRKTNLELFEMSFRISSFFGLICSISVVILGDISGSVVAKYQPAKFAGIESLWETKSGAPMYLFMIPDEENERNKVEFLEIPKLLSFLAYRDLNAPVKGLKEFPKDERPTVWPIYISFRLMVAIGFILVLSAILASYYSYKKLILNKIWLLKWLIFMIPLSYLANQLGWIVTEMGRQPWVVYNLLKVKDAVSINITPFEVTFSLVAFLLIYTIIGIIGFYLIIKNALKEPSGVSL